MIFSLESVLHVVGLEDVCETKPDTMSVAGYLLAFSANVTCEISASLVLSFDV